MAFAGQDPTWDEKTETEEDGKERVYKEFDKDANGQVKRVE